MKWEREDERGCRCTPPFLFFLLYSYSDHTLSRQQPTRPYHERRHDNADADADDADADDADADDADNADADADDADDADADADTDRHR
jgi:hypothetical protein